MGYGSRIPALFTHSSGTLQHRMSIPGNSNYAFGTSNNINTWYTIEYSQEFEENQWKFKIKMDGQIVKEIAFSQEPATYESVKVYFSDNLYNPGQALICNFTFYTDYTDV